MILWIILVILCYNTLLCRSDSGSVSSSEFQSLVDLYDSTSGTEWKWRDEVIFGPVWLNNSVTPCSSIPWQGLTCDCSGTNSTDYCSIIAIELEDYRLIGTLPSSIVNFTNLILIDLSLNDIYGLIPSTIGGLSNLELISFSYNNLQGNIPYGLYELVSLRYLSLDFNKLNGSIAPEINQLENLEFLFLNTNQFHGLSDEVFDLQKLKLLDGHFNFFPGSLPSAISNAVSLMHIDFTENYFTGSIPETLCNAPSLRNIHLGYNILHGPIDNIYDCTGLKQFTAQENFFTGTISNEISKLKQLEFLYLDFTFISGTLPPALFTMSNLTHLYLNNMNLNGSIPAELFMGLYNIERLLLYNNFFTGSIPQEVGQAIHLLELHMGNNYLTSSLPVSIGNLTYLKLLAIDYNILNGPIPTTIGSLVNLKLLNLGGNYFSSTLPNEFYSLNKLRFVSILNNWLSGTISKSIGSMRLLNTIEFGTNRFNGTIPDAFGGLKFLVTLHLSDNELTGRIPESIYTCKNLTNVNLGNNHLIGTISESISNISESLQVFIFNNNEITGTLPEVIGLLQRMVALEGQYNKLTGSIPTALCLFEGADLFMEYNYLSSSIPECIFKVYSLTEIVANNNLLTGTIPSNFTNTALTNILLYDNYLTGSLPSRTSDKVLYFAVYNNSFTGTLLEDFFAVGAFLQLALDTNYLSGTIPRTLNNATTVNYLSLYTNILSGSMPYIGDLSALSVFYVDSNQLSGSIACFNSKTQLYLSSVDVSNNQFTGTIPEELFRIPLIESVSTVQNCFTGTIPEIICNATVLTALALDGLHSASSCRFNLFRGNYALKYHIPGSIPICLFNMPKLQTLHMSGNGMSGSLPWNLTIAEPLTDIAVSYNQISGPIPLELQLKSFFNYDLSFNNFGGILLPFTAAVPLNGSVFLRVNRLSGRIPPLLRDMDTISILNSNIFECQYDRTQLPKNDDQSFYYECGTSSLQHSVYIFVGLGGLVMFLLCIGICIATKKRIQTSGSEFIKWIKQLYDNSIMYFTTATTISKKEYENITLLHKYINNLRHYTLILTCFVVLVLMPTYIALSFYYSMYQYKYAWNVSSVYLSGVVPAWVLFILYLILIALIFYCGIAAGKEFHPMDAIYIRKTTFVTSLRDYYPHYIGLILIGIFNIFSVLIVNIGYVLASTHLTPESVTLVQILLATFKLLWNDIVVRGLTKSLHALCTKSKTLSQAEERLWDSRYLAFNTYMLLFNIIISPCIATAAVSSDCFYNTYFDPLNVVSTITYETCDDFKTVISQSLSPNCSSYSYSTYTTSFLPPYIYRYKCASTLVTTYTAIYVYKFIFAAFLQPLLFMYLMRLCDRLNPQSWLYEFINLIVLQVKHSAKPGTSHRTFSFQPDRFNLRYIMYLAVFVTFGVMFPPLVMMICIAIYTQTFCAQISIGRLIMRTEDQDRKTVLSYINQDCMNTGVMFKRTVYVIAGPASFFYAYFLFDMYGDAVGALRALWMALTTFLLGIAGIVVYKFIINRSDHPTDGTPETIELARPSSLRSKRPSSEKETSDEMADSENPIHVTFE